MSPNCFTDGVKIVHGY